MRSYAWKTARQVAVKSSAAMAIPSSRITASRLGVDPERERDRSRDGQRGEDEQRLQRERVREVEMDALVVARDLPRQDPVLAEPAEDGDEGRDRETRA